MAKSIQGSIREQIMNVGRRIVTQSGKWVITKSSDRTRLLELLQRLHPVVPEQGLRRIGPAGDGGYLLPDDLDGIAACFSPGVGDLSGFELDCVELGMRAHLADASVASPQFDDERLDFISKFIRAVPDAESITLDEWVATAEPNEADDLLLQIDIEGDEWGVFAVATPSLLRRFRVIVAEFHNLNGLHNSDAFKFQALVFEKLLESHTCIHIHPNNCCGAETTGGITIPPVAEFTFVRNDRIDRGRARFATQFPHPLDADNVGPRPTVTLPSSMYRSN
jgi:hypothetical protein